MKIILDLQNAVDSEQLPDTNKMHVWITSALNKAQAKFENPEITIRVVSAEESQQLNFEYRDKNKPTNVLSFPFEAPEMIPIEDIGEFLGDLVICEKVVIREAKEQQKSLEEHWAHMIVHGVFHLLGYDHIEEQEAEEMEALEIALLSDFGFANPYL